MPVTLKERLKNHLRARLWSDEVAEQVSRNLVDELLDQHGDVLGPLIAERFMAQWPRVDAASSRGHQQAEADHAAPPRDEADPEDEVRQMAEDLSRRMVDALQQPERLEQFDDWLADLVSRVKPPTRETPARVAPERSQLEAMFDQAWARLASYVDTDTDAFEKQLAVARWDLRKIHQVRERSLELICEDDILHLRDASLRFIDRKALWTVIREILVNEEYYFEHPDDAPRIIDGGSNFGLSLYYFKHLYPNAKILGFEPAQDLWEMACENVKRNGWQDVELLPYALAGADGTQTFYDAPADRLGGSLTQRKLHFDAELVEHEVVCRRLSTYLAEPVDFLKLDIEGAEREVLPEIREQLPNIRHVFCEYHVDPDVRPELLGQTVQLLEQADFHVHVGKSDSFGQSTHERPMDAVGRPISLVIWAKNRRPMT
ncbi:MAG: FkbM family methyltransferase [Phycisphaeraceae bacterium]